MKVSELFRKLSFGELSNLSLANSGDGTIALDKHPKLIGYVNDGLMSLYSRFVLRENDVLLRLVVPRRNYELNSRYSLINPTPTPGDDLYIDDSVERPFQNDVLKITAVYDGAGQLLPLNDPDSAYSMFTPQPAVLQVPKPATGAILAVVYQASPLPIPDDDDLTTEIMLPPVLDKALQSYVAAMVFSHMGGQENTAKGAEHLAIYEAVCSQVEQGDLVNNSMSSTNTRFAKGGWI